MLLSRPRVLSVEPSPAAGLPATDYMIQIDSTLGSVAPGSTLVVRVPGRRRAGRHRPQDLGRPRVRAGRTRASLPRRARRRHLPHPPPRPRRVPGGRGRRQDARRARPHRSPRGSSRRWRHARGRRDGGRATSTCSPIGSTTAAAGIRREPTTSSPPCRAVTSARTRARRREVLAADPAPSLPSAGLNSMPAAASSSAPIRSASPGLPGGGFDEFQRALAAWNGDPATPVNYVFGGTTPAAGGFSEADGVNAILFNDPNGDIEDAFVCGEGGILAIGGPAFVPDNPRHLQRQDLHPPLEADIVTNTGSPASSPVARTLAGTPRSCLPTSSATRSASATPAQRQRAEAPPVPANPVLDDATMARRFTCDGRGASLRADDRAGIAFLYRNGPQRRRNRCTEQSRAMAESRARCCSRGTIARTTS